MLRNSSEPVYGLLASEVKEAGRRVVQYNAQNFSSGPKRPEALSFHVAPSIASSPTTFPEFSTPGSASSELGYG